MTKANADSKGSYRSNFANPAVTDLLTSRRVQEVARMDDEVTTLLNVTLGADSDDYRGNVRRIITGTLDQCVRKGLDPAPHADRHRASARIVSAEEYEAQSTGLVCVTDDVVRMLADGLTVTGKNRNGHKYTRVMPGTGIAPWLQRTMGLRMYPGTCTCAGRLARTARR